MKHLLVFALFLVAFAQPVAAQDQWLFWKYKDYDGSMSFTIPGFLPKIGSVFVKGKAERRLIRRTGKTRVMIFEQDSPLKPTDFKKLTRRANNSGLSEIVMVREGKTHVRVMAKENGKRIRKLLVMVQSEDGEFVMVSMKGRFKYSDLNTLIKKYQDQEKKRDKKPNEKEKPKFPVKVPVVSA